MGLNHRPRVRRTPSSGRGTRDGLNRRPSRTSSASWRASAALTAPEPPPAASVRRRDVRAGPSAPSSARRTSTGRPSTCWTARSCGQRTGVVDRPLGQGLELRPGDVLGLGLGRRPSRSGRRPGRAAPAATATARRRRSAILGLPLGWRRRGGRCVVGTAERRRARRQGGRRTPPGPGSTPSRRARSSRSKPSLRTRRSKYRTVSTAAERGVVSALLSVCPMKSPSAIATSFPVMLTRPVKTPSKTPCTTPWMMAHEEHHGQHRPPPALHQLARPFQRFPAADLLEQQDGRGDRPGHVEVDRPGRRTRGRPGAGG